MLIRYKKGADGLDAVAQVYSKDENKIDPLLVDKNAVSVVKRLNDAGFESYIVGGAVRDLLLGRIPKDFDIATSASPRQVRRLFYNSRIIGRRFRIVHITFGSQIIEVSTFRSTKEHEATSDNEFGTIEEDSARRDFSINSLYYDPIKCTLIDFNHALDDFKNKRIVSLIPLNKTFNEDPVRMIRAVKYSVTTGFKIPLALSLAIKHYAPNIGTVSRSRMTEEVNKILSSGESSTIFQRLNSYKLLAHILPAISVYADFPQLFQSLQLLDDKVKLAKSNQAPQVSKEEMYLALVQPFISRNDDWTGPEETFSDILRQIKILINPITPANYELEMATFMYMQSIDLEVPAKCIKHKKPQISSRQYPRRSSISRRFSKPSPKSSYRPSSKSLSKSAVRVSKKNSTESAAKSSAQTSSMPAVNVNEDIATVGAN